MNVDDGCSDDDEIEVVSQGGVKGGGRNKGEGK